MLRQGVYRKGVYRQGVYRKGVYRVRTGCVEGARRGFALTLPRATRITSVFPRISLPAHTFDAHRISEHTL